MNVMNSRCQAKYPCLSGAWEGWPYLATVIDDHSRRVIGWAIDERMRANLVEDALRMAISLRGELPGQVTCHFEGGTIGPTPQLYGALSPELHRRRSPSRQKHLLWHQGIHSFHARHGVRIRNFQGCCRGVIDDPTFRNDSR